MISTVAVSSLTPVEAFAAMILLILAARSLSFTLNETATPPRARYAPSFVSGAESTGLVSSTTGSSVLGSSVFSVVCSSCFCSSCLGSSVFVSSFFSSEGLVSGVGSCFGSSFSSSL